MMIFCDERLRQRKRRQKSGDTYEVQMTRSHWNGTGNAILVWFRHICCFPRRSNSTGNRGEAESAMIDPKRPNPGNSLSAGWISLSSLDRLMVAEIRNNLPAQRTELS